MRRPARISRSNNYRDSVIGKATAAIAALAAILTLAPEAGATLLPTGPVPGGGGFVIQSCGESASAQGWTASNNAPARVETFTDCPTTAGRIPEFPDLRYYTGLHAGGKRGRDSATLDDAQAGDQAELTFTANAGTQITRVRMWRYLLKNDDNDWWPYIKAGATTIDSCEFSSGATVCSVGGAGAWTPNAENDMDEFHLAWYDSAPAENLPNLATSTFTVGILCRAQGNSICGNGYLAPDSAAEIYSAFLTLTDPSTPTLGTTGGDWNGTGPLTTAPAFTVAGTDNSGIRAARLYLDGQQVAEQLSSCSYDRPRPCNDLPASAPLGFNPATISDGAHQLQLAVVDAAGNETRTVPVTRTVDGTPPAPPTAAQTQAVVNEATVSWQPAAAGAIATVSSEWRLCRYEGQECGQWNPVSTPSGSIVQPVYAPRLSVDVRNIDALGRTGAETTVALPWTYVPTPGTSTTTTGTGTTTTPPVTPPGVVKKKTSLKLAKASGPGKRIVALSGTVSVKTAKISITLTRKGHKRIIRNLGAKSGKFTLRIGHVPRGRWKITLRYTGSSTRLPATAARTITVR